MPMGGVGPRVIFVTMRCLNIHEVLIVGIMAPLKIRRITQKTYDFDCWSQGLVFVCSPQYRASSLLPHQYGRSIARYCRIVHSDIYEDHLRALPFDPLYIAVLSVEI